MCHAITASGGLRHRSRVAHVALDEGKVGMPPQFKQRLASGTQNVERANLEAGFEEESRDN